MYKLDITYSWDDAEEGKQFTSEFDRLEKEAVTALLG